MKCKRIMLTGFMGCGKTTIGRALSARLRYPFADTDSMIEEMEGKNISEIFRDSGEVYFRSLEHRLTYDLTRGTSIVVSSGGGYILTNAVYQIAASNFTIVFIDTPFELCLSRIRENKARPLAVNRTTEELLDVYEERKRIYRVRSDFAVDGSKALLSEIVNDIIEGMK